MYVNETINACSNFQYEIAYMREFTYITHETINDRRYKNDSYRNYSKSYVRHGNKFV